MRKYLLCFYIHNIAILLLHSYCVNSQNLIPNPSFESSNSITSCSNLIFEHVIWDWASIYRYGSPDIYSSQIEQNCPNIQKRHLQPTDGNACIGFCTIGEQVKTELNNSLEIGMIYYLSFWIRADSTSLLSNNFGVLFTERELSISGEEEIIKEPQINIHESIPNINQWKKKEFIFIADKPYDYINIGNFHGSHNTIFDTLNTTHSAFYNFLSSYIYLDNLLLTPFKSINTDFYSNFNHDIQKKAKSLFNHNFFFENDSYEITKNDLFFLKKIAYFLQKNHFITLEIIGYTDKTGNSKYNINLSQKRAESIKKILTKRGGVNEDRISAIGKGISEHADDDKQNRTVELIFSTKVF